MDTIRRYELAFTHGQRTIVKAGNAVIGGSVPVIISGPCAVENEATFREAAKIVKAICGPHALLRAGLWKPRTDPGSFQGLERDGLAIVERVKKEFGLPIVSEIVSERDMEIMASVVDMFQVGSRNMANYDLLKALGRQSKPVLLKNGMGSKVEEWLLAAEYILSQSNNQVVLCERGIRTLETFTRNTLDLSVVPYILQYSHLPIIVDPSHGTGLKELVIPMAQASLMVGAHGLMVEMHPHADQALCDGQQALSPDDLADLMDEVNSLAAYIQTRKKE